MINFNHVAKATFLSFLSLAIGFGVGKKFPPPDVALALPNQVLTNQPEILRTINQAATTLTNCFAFKRMYKARYKTFLAMLRRPISLGYAGQDFESYAWTIPASDTIWLTSEYFRQLPAEQERTIAHEMLHLVGFPQHDPKNVYKDDQTYQLSDACYPGLPAEAE